MAFYSRVKKKNPGFLRVCSDPCLPVCPHTGLLSSLTPAPWPPPRPLPIREAVCIIVSPFSHVSCSCPLLREVLLTTPLNVASPFLIVLGPTSWLSPAMYLSKTNTYIVLYTYYSCFSLPKEVKLLEPGSHLFRSL